jgi:hypothetical protein
VFVGDAGKKIPLWSAPADSGIALVAPTAVTPGSARIASA